MTRRAAGPRASASAFFAVVGAAWLLVTMASPAAAASACTGGAAGLIASAIAFDHTLHLGRTTVTLVTALMTNRVDGYTVDDVIPSFAGFAPEQGVAGFGPRTTGHLVGSRDLLITDASATLFDWDGGGPPTGPGRPVSVVGSGGVVTVPYPSRPGRYVLEFIVQWRTTCVRGDGVAAVAIDSSLPATDAASSVRHTDPKPQDPTVPLSLVAGGIAGLLVYARIEAALGQEQGFTNQALAQRAALGTPQAFRTLCDARRPTNAR